VTALPAPPAAQPDGQAQHHVLSDKPQAAATQLVGCERSGLFATAAKLSVTRTLGTSSTYGLIVFLDFAYSCRAGQFDTDGKIFLEGRSEDPLSTALLLLLLCAHRPPERREGGGVLDKSNRAGLLRGIGAGFYPADYKKTPSGYSGCAKLRAAIGRQLFLPLVKCG
jgi:hypothetical protein